MKGGARCRWGAGNVLVGVHFLNWSLMYTGGATRMATRPLCVCVVVLVVVGGEGEGQDARTHWVFYTAEA